MNVNVGDVLDVNAIQEQGKWKMKDGQEDVTVAQAQNEEERKGPDPRNAGSTVEDAP